MEKTKYRVENDGGFYYLQYLTYYKILWITIRNWKYVKNPHYIPDGSCTWEKYDIYIWQQNSDYSEFISKWVYIKDYKAWAKNEQDKVLEMEYEKKRKNNEYYIKNIN